MTTVDERVVEMRFNNAEFEKHAQTSLKTLKNLQDSSQMRGASEGLDRVGKSLGRLNMNGLSNAVDTVRAKFSAFEVVAVTALANIANSTVNAGKRLINSFTLEPVTQGFSEYELKMNSVQTIMASTGADIQTVNKYLNELNTYADKTIYSFSDMTASIGKFTNAGVDLDSAVKAIQGISNEAAVSGANANEASHAMYNFAQALSAGSVKLIDWKSIENANMATVEFKQQLIDTAVELGTLVKSGDDYISTTTDLKGHVSEAFNSTKMFNDSLSAQWMTTDVLVKTLGRYADETTEIGKKAFAAAQDVKTFSQLMDTLKEAAGSGWATSFEMIFGDKEEAKELWTGVSKVLGGAIDKMSDARNAMLGTWKELGGRKDLIDSVSNSYKGLLSVIKPIKKAFRDVFPPMTGERLAGLTKSLKEFTAHLKLSKKDAHNLRDTFRGLFSVFSLLKQAIGGVATSLFPMTKDVGKLGSNILEVTASVGRWITGLDEAARKNQTFSKAGEKLSSGLTALADIFQSASKKAKSFGDSLSKVFSGLGSGEDFSLLEKAGKILSGFGKGVSEGFEKASPVLKKVGSVFGTALSAVGKAIGDFLQNADFDALVSLLNSGILLYFGKTLGGMFKEISGVSNKAGGILDGIKEVLSGAGDALEKFQQSIQIENLKKIAISIGILTVSLLALSTLDAEKLGTSLMGIAGLMGSLLGTMAVISKIGAIDGIMKTSTAMIEMSVAVLILASALKKVSAIEPDKLAIGLLAIGTLMTELVAVSIVMDKTGAKMVKGSAGLILFAGALLIMSEAVKRLGNIDVEAIKTGLLTIAGILAEISLFSQIVKPQGMVATGLGMIAMGAAFEIIADVISKIGAMNLETIGKGLLGIGGALAEIGVFVALVPTADLLLMGPAMVVMSAGIQGLASALSSMGGMSWKELAVGLIALGGSLAILAAGAIAMTGALPGAAAMLVMGTALRIFVPALMTLGKIKLSQLGVGLVALAGAFAVLGAASAILSPLIPAMLGLAGTMTLLGVAVAGVGAGVALAGAGLLMLGSAISTLVAKSSTDINTFVDNIKQIVISILTMVPDVATALAEAVIEFAKVLADGAPTIAESGITIISEFLGMIGTLFPQIVNTGIGMLLALLDGIGQNIGDVVDKATLIIVNFLKGIADNIDDIADAGLEVLWAFLNAIVNKAVEGVAVGADLAGKVLQGLGDAASGFLEAGKNAVRGFVNGLLSIPGELIAAGASLGKKALEAAKNALDINSPSRKFEKVGVWSVQGYIGGFDKESKNARKQVLKSLKGILNYTAKHMYDSKTRAAVKAVSGELNKDLKSRLETRLQNDSIGLEAAKKIKEYRKQLKTLKAEKASAETVLNSKTATKAEKNSALKEVEDISNRIKQLHEEIGKQQDIIQNRTKKLVTDMSKTFVKEIRMMEQLKEIDKKVAATVAKIPKAVDAYVGNSKSVTEYASGTVKKFTRSFGNKKSGNSKAVNTLDTFAQKLYKESDSYKETVKNLKSYTKELEKLEKKKKALEPVAKGLSELKKKQEELEKVASDSKATKEQKARAKEELNTVKEQVKNAEKAKNSIKDLNKQVKDTSKSITKETKNLAKGPQKALKQFTKSIRESIKEFTKLSNVSFEKIFSGFNRIEKSNNLVEEATTAYDMFGVTLKTVSEEIKETSDSMGILSVSADTGINLLDRFSKVSSKSVRRLMKNAKSQLKAYAEFQNGIADLRSRGLDSSFVDELEEQGPDALSYIRGFLKMSGDEIAEYNSLVAKKTDYEAQAVEKNMQKTVSKYEQWVKDIEKLASRGLSDGIIEKLKEAGVGQAEFVSALTHMSGATISNVNSMYAQSVTSAITESVVEDTTEGYATFLEGIRAKAAEYEQWNKDLAMLATKGLSDKVIEKLREMGIDQTKDYIASMLKESAAGLAEINEYYAKSINNGRSAAEVWLSNMQVSTDTYEKWQSDMKKLAKKLGKDDPLYQSIMSMGWEAGAEYADAFLSASAEQQNKIVDEFNKQQVHNSEAIIQSLKDRVKIVKQWKKDLETLAKTDGMNDSLMSELVEMGPEAYEKVHALTQMSKEEFKVFATEYEAAVTNVPKQISQSVTASYAFVATDAIEGFAKTVSNQTNVSKVKQSVNAVIEKASKTADTNSKKESKNVASNVVSTVKGVLNKSAGKEIGSNFSAGLVSGLNSNKSMVTSAARSLARAAYNSMKKELDINSPSKKTEELGSFSDIGFANGLLKYVGKVKDAAGRVSEAMLDSLGNGMSSLNGYLSGEVISTPTVRPVLDLSNATYEASTLSGMINASGNLNINIGRDANRDVVNAINSMREDFGRQVLALSESISQMQVVMDSGALVGQLAEPMDQAFAQRAVFSGRGM